MKRLGAVLDFPAEVVRLNCRDEEAELPTIPEYVTAREPLGGTDTEDFTSDSEDGENNDQVKHRYA